MIVTALPKLFKLSPGERVQRSSGQLVPLLWPQHIDESRQRGQGLPVCGSKPSNPSRPVWPQVSAFYFNNVIIIWWWTDYYINLILVDELNKHEKILLSSNGDKTISDKSSSSINQYMLPLLMIFALIDKINQQIAGYRLK